MFVPTYFSTEQGIDSGTDKGVEIKEMSQQSPSLSVLALIPEF